MQLSQWKLLASLVAMAVAGAPQLATAEISEAEFLRLHRELRPSADESWRTIPWKIALLNAQEIAAAEKKPLFIWAMDGHPLGCT